MTQQPANLELIYFQSRCKGDLPRMLMIEGGLDFQDTRLHRREGWQERKSEFVFGQLPVLRVDGREIAQSHAIARYIAKLTDPGLLGDNIDEAANVDMWYYQTEDVYLEVIMPFYGNPDIIDQLFTDNWSKWVAPFEKVLSSGSNYLANNKLSLADYHLFDVAEVTAAFKPELLGQTPGVRAHRERMVARPGMVKFLAHVKGLPLTTTGRL